MSVNLLVDIKKKLLDHYDYQEGKTYTFLNPYSYLVLREQGVDDIDCIYIDGLLLVLLLKLLRVSAICRISFDMTSLAPVVFDRVVSERKKIYFIGSDEDSINKFIAKMDKEFPAMDIVGFRNGYLEKDMLGAVIDAIFMLNPDYVVVGMGTPLQENFLRLLKRRGWKGTGFTCGGFIHQTASSNSINYYPLFVDKLNLRWLYRLYDEPKLVRRYFLDYPKSIVFLIFDVMREKIKFNS